MQRAAAHASPHRFPTHPSVEELRNRNHSMLPRGDLGDSSVPPGDFPGHGKG